MSSTNSSSRGTWLDLLPFVVGERLAVHVSRGQYSLDTLHLGESSPQQREVVVSALEYKFVEEKLRKHEILPRWVRLFVPSVRSVVFCPTIFYDDDDEDEEIIWEDVLPLLTAKSLREAIVNYRLHGELDVLAAVAKTKNLEKLTVHIWNRSAYLALFDETLPALKSLESLDLICSPDDDECPFQDTRFFSSTKNALAEACPNLTSLYLSCPCDYCREEDPLWRILPGMPNVREVKFFGKLPSNAAEKLRKVDIVKFTGYSSAPYKIVLACGIRVTVLYCHYEDLTMEQVAGLKVCSDLRELSIAVEDGAERELPLVFAKMPVLRKLHVKWVLPETWRHIIGGGWQSHNSYCSTDPGVILKTITAAPLLDTLGLSDVKVSLTEMKEVMAFLGSRLKCFSFSLGGQDEFPHVRLHEILRTARRYNPFITYIDVTDCPRFAAVRTIEELEGLKKIRECLIADIRALNERAPCFRARCLDRVMKLYASVSGELGEFDEGMDNVEGSVDNGESEAEL